MKKIIAILRSIGILSLVLFVVLSSLQKSEASFTLLCISACAFASTLLLQIYRFYIYAYFYDEEVDTE